MAIDTFQRPCSSSTSNSLKSRFRWAEIAEDKEEDFEDYLLPPPLVIGPDENGVKKIVEYKFNDDGNKVEITTTTQAKKLTKTRVSKSAVERRSWPRFGDALHEHVGSNLTVVSTEQIHLERVNAPGSKAESTKYNNTKGSVSLINCRTCGKDHWTAMCPYKDIATQPELFIENPTAPDSSKKAYVPPTLRKGGGERPGQEMRRRNDDNSVRVSNLSEDTREPDLRELFSSFGDLTRVFVSKDHNTGVSKGFGFVNFVRRDDAERAINKLNGYGYDNLILSVEWAGPRNN